MSKLINYCLWAVTFFLLPVRGEAQVSPVATGIVRSATSKAPVQSATVRAVKDGEVISSVLTGKDGKFVFYELPEGDITLIITHKSFESQTISNYKIKTGELVSTLVDLKPATTTSVAVRSGQKITITGNVTDTTGANLQGVTVMASQKTNATTTTDVNGKFVLDVTPGTLLAFSMVGFLEESRLISDTTSTAINIILRPVQSQLDQVIVTAFGKKEMKEAVTGSVTTIDPQKLRIPASNLTNALAGQLAGIIAYQSSGQPGLDNSTFFIRGATTFGFARSPLILIDNIELTADDLARLQVDDIASFSLLKDASATALYGSRGANGVILVTTKQGKEGAPKLDFRFENSISEPTQSVKLANPITYMKMYNEAIITRDPLAERKYSENDILFREQGRNPYAYPSVDWLGELFKKRTNNQRTNFNLSGGGKVARYYIAGSFAQDNGILKVDKRNDFNSNVKLQNYQLRSNINVTVTPTTTANILLWGNFNEYTGPLTADASFATDLYDRAIRTSPVDFPAYHLPDSSTAHLKHIMFGNSRVGTAGLFVNPYAELMKGYKNFSRSRMSAQFELLQDLAAITPGLTFKGTLSTNRFSFFQVSRQYLPYYYQAVSYDRIANTYQRLWLNNQPGQAREYLDFTAAPSDREINTFLLLQGILSYARNFGKHNLGGSLIGLRQQTLNASSEGATDLQGSLPYRNIGLSGEATYGFDRKYFLRFNFGYNGSERFSEKNRMGFFPTLGVSWVPSNENFWKGISAVVTRLKFNASYGLVGNDAIGSAAERFFYLSNVNLSGGNGAVFGTENAYSRPGVTISRYDNPAITWEVSKQTNLRMEMDLFRDLNIVAEIYKQNRESIFMSRTTIPSTLGLEAGISANVGKAMSRGIDLSVDYKRNFGPNAFVTARGNATITDSRYIAYEEPTWTEPWRYRAGQPIGQGFGYIAERLFVDDEDVANAPVQNFGSQRVRGGDIKYRDMNGDGVISERDQVPIGLPESPQITYGFGFTSAAKQFDLSVFFQGNARRSFWLNVGSIAPFVNNTQVMQLVADDYWSEENQNIYAQWPRLSTQIIENNVQRSTWFMRNGSYLRLRTVEAGYTIPNNLAKKIAMKSLRLYLSGQNLLTWGVFKDWDPELAGNGLAYPIQRSYNIGLLANF